MKNTVQLFKALSDETRLRILALLFDRELCVCDFMAVLELPQSTASRHLAYLRNAGWVTDRRQTKWMYYQINTANKKLSQDLLAVLHQHLPLMVVIEQDKKRLENYLAVKQDGACS